MDKKRIIGLTGLIIGSLGVAGLSYGIYVPIIENDEMIKNPKYKCLTLDNVKYDKEKKKQIEKLKKEISELYQEYNKSETEEEKKSIAKKIEELKKEIALISKQIAKPLYRKCMKLVPAQHKAIQNDEFKKEKRVFNPQPKELIDDKNYNKEKEKNIKKEEKDYKKGPIYTIQPIGTPKLIKSECVIKRKDNIIQIQKKLKELYEKMKEAKSQKEKSEIILEIVEMRKALFNSYPKCIKNINRDKLLKDRKRIIEAWTKRQKQIREKQIEKLKKALQEKKERLKNRKEIINHKINPIKDRIERPLQKRITFQPAYVKKQERKIKKIQEILRHRLYNRIKNDKKYYFILTRIKDKLEKRYEKIKSDIIKEKIKLIIKAIENEINNLKYKK